MNVLRLEWLLIVAAALAPVTGSRASTPATATSDEKQIRDAALIVMDASRPFTPETLDSIVLEGDAERQFAAEMLKAMRAEQNMMLRAAVAVGGSEDSNEARQMHKAAAASTDAIAAAEIVVNGDSATMPFAPGGGRSTTLTFRKVDGRWRIDLLRRYRERKQIDAVGIARWKAHQQAAEWALEIYEKKQERDLSALPLIYETMSNQLAEAAAKRIGTTSTTRPIDR